MQGSSNQDKILFEYMLHQKEKIKTNFSNKKKETNNKCRMKNHEVKKSSKFDSTDISKDSLTNPSKLSSKISNPNLLEYYENKLRKNYIGELGPKISEKSSVTNKSQDASEIKKSNEKITKPRNSTSSIKKNDECEHSIRNTIIHKKLQRRPSSFIQEFLSSETTNRDSVKAKNLLRRFLNNPTEKENEVPQRESIPPHHHSNALNTIYKKYSSRVSDYLLRNKKKVCLFGNSKYLNKNAEEYLKDGPRRSLSSNQSEMRVELEEKEIIHPTKIIFTNNPDKNGTEEEDETIQYSVHPEIGRGGIVNLTPVPVKLKNSINNEKDKVEYNEVVKSAIAMRRYEYHKRLISNHFKITRESIKSHKKYALNSVIMIQNKWRKYFYGWVLPKILKIQRYLRIHNLFEFLKLRRKMKNMLVYELVEVENNFKIKYKKEALLKIINYFRLKFAEILRKKLKIRLFTQKILSVFFLKIKKVFLNFEKRIIPSIKILKRVYILKDIKPSLEKKISSLESCLRYVIKFMIFQKSRLKKINSIGNFHATKLIRINPNIKKNISLVPRFYSKQLKLNLDTKICILERFLIKIKKREFNLRKFINKVYEISVQSQTLLIYQAFHKLNLRIYPLLFKSKRIWIEKTIRFCPKKLPHIEPFMCTKKCNIDLSFINKKIILILNSIKKYVILKHLKSLKTRKIHKENNYLEMILKLIQKKRLILDSSQSKNSIFIGSKIKLNQKDYLIRSLKCLKRLFHIKYITPRKIKSLSKMKNKIKRNQEIKTIFKKFFSEHFTLFKYYIQKPIPVTFTKKFKLNSLNQKAMTIINLFKNIKKCKENTLEKKIISKPLLSQHNLIKTNLVKFRQKVHVNGISLISKLNIQKFSILKKLIVNHFTASKIIRKKIRYINKLNPVYIMKSIYISYSVFRRNIKKIINILKLCLPKKPVSKIAIEERKFYKKEYKINIIKGKSHIYQLIPNFLARKCVMEFENFRRIFFSWKIRAKSTSIEFSVNFIKSQWFKMKKLKKSSLTKRFISFMGKKVLQNYFNKLSEYALNKKAINENNSKRISKLFIYHLSLNTVRNSKMIDIYFKKWLKVVFLMKTFHSAKLIIRLLRLNHQIHQHSSKLKQIFNDYFNIHKINFIKNASFLLNTLNDNSQSLAKTQKYLNHLKLKAALVFLRKTKFSANIYKTIKLLFLKLELKNIKFSFFLKWWQTTKVILLGEKSLTFVFSLQISLARKFLIEMKSYTVRTSRLKRLHLKSCLKLFYLFWYNKIKNSNKIKSSFELLERAFITNYKRMFVNNLISWILNTNFSYKKLKEIHNKKEIRCSNFGFTFRKNLIFSHKKSIIETSGKNPYLIFQILFLIRKMRLSNSFASILNESKSKSFYSKFAYLCKNIVSINAKKISIKTLESKKVQSNLKSKLRNIFRSYFFKYVNLILKQCGNINGLNHFLGILSLKIKVNLRKYIFFILLIKSFESINDERKPLLIDLLKRGFLSNYLTTFKNYNDSIKSNNTRREGFNKYFKNFMLKLKKNPTFVKSHPIELEFKSLEQKITMRLELKQVLKTDGVQEFDFNNIFTNIAKNRELFKKQEEIEIENAKSNQKVQIHTKLSNKISKKIKTTDEEKWIYLRDETIDETKETRKFS